MVPRRDCLPGFAGEPITAPPLAHYKSLFAQALAYAFMVALLLLGMEPYWAMALALIGGVCATFGAQRSSRALWPTATGLLQQLMAR